MKEWTREELEKAELQLCIGGKAAGVAFIERHPELGFALAVDLQCENNEARELLEKSLGLLVDDEKKRQEWLERNKESK